MTRMHLPLLFASMTLAAGGSMAQSHWDWQLSEPYDLLSHDVQVMDIDPDNHSASDIAALSARGVKTICYVSVGTAEEYRDDVANFPASVIGKTYGDWPDEKFLDIRQIDALLPIMTARFQRCRDMGFSAVEPDNMDVYTNDSGFAISAADTVAYMRALANVAHGMGLQIGQKNVPELTPSLVGMLDFVVTEGCYVDGWCEQVFAYIQQGKPVYAAEYTDTRVNFTAACSFGAENGYHFILKNRDLTSKLGTC